MTTEFDDAALMAMLVNAFPGAAEHLVGALDCGTKRGMGIVYGRHRWAERISSMDEAQEAIKRLRLRKFMRAVAA